MAATSTARQHQYVAAVSDVEQIGASCAVTQLIATLDCFQQMVALDILPESQLSRLVELFRAQDTAFFSLDCQLQGVGGPDEQRGLVCREPAAAGAALDLVLCVFPPHFDEQPPPADLHALLDQRSAATVTFAAFGVDTAAISTDSTSTIGADSAASDSTATDEATQRRRHRRHHHHHHRHHHHRHATTRRYFFQSGGGHDEGDDAWLPMFGYRTHISGAATAGKLEGVLLEAFRCFQLERELRYFLRAGGVLATQLVHAWHVVHTIRQQSSKDAFYAGMMHFFFHDGKPSRSWPKPTSSSKSASFFSSTAEGTPSSFTGPLLAPHFASPFHERVDVRGLCFRSSAQLRRGLWTWGDEDPRPALYRPTADAAQLSSLLDVDTQRANAPQYHMPGDDETRLQRSAEPDFATVRGIGSVHNTKDDRRGIFLQLFVPHMLPMAVFPDLFEWFYKNLPNVARMGQHNQLRRVLGALFDLPSMHVDCQQHEQAYSRVRISGRLNKPQLQRDHPDLSVMLNKVVSARIVVTDVADAVSALSVSFAKGGESFDLEFYVDPVTADLLAAPFSPAAPAMPAQPQRFTWQRGDTLHMHFNLAVSFLGFDWTLPSVVVNLERSRVDGVGASSDVVTIDINDIKLTPAIRKLLELIGFGDLLGEFLRNSRITLLLNADLYITIQSAIPRSRIFAAAMSGRVERYYHRVFDLLALGVRIGTALINDLNQQA